MGRFIAVAPQIIRLAASPFRKEHGGAAFLLEVPGETVMIRMMVGQNDPLQLPEADIQGAENPIPKLESVRRMDARIQHGPAAIPLDQVRIYILQGVGHRHPDLENMRVVLADDSVHGAHASTRLLPVMMSRREVSGSYGVPS
ncbi:hypothetical protein D3C75_1029990 [compost metagenome]